VRILVSVDASSDRTDEICCEFAKRDSRIQVIVQRERLCWSRNANFLLDRVDTEYFFLYFHDDIISSFYTEKLLGELRGRPDAMSIHCDLERFGGETGLILGNHYSGTDSRRIIMFLVGPEKCTPLRSLTRSEMLGKGLRFAEIGVDGFWRCHPFLLTLLAAGEALRYPEVLYLRWFLEGSLTKNWTPESEQALVEGQKQNLHRCLEIIDSLRASAEELELVRCCLRIFIMFHTRRTELKMGGSKPIAPSMISPMLEDLEPPEAIYRAEPDVQEWVRSALSELAKTEARLKNSGAGTR